MVCNLINNAVDACNKQAAEITIKLNADNEWVRFTIEDNGKGMSKAIIKKIKNRVAITEGKESGHGIGLIQVHETLERNQGDMTFHSIMGQGTTITLTFPRIKAPAWMAEAIKLKPKDTVIVLDDDTSIHGAWDTHFQAILTETSNIQLKHYSMGQQALDFIQTLSPAEKKHLFLLTDFELLTQDLDGLTVIEKSGIARSILVTSHYTNPVVRERAAKVGSKILPKQMASEIPIQIEDILQEMTDHTPRIDIVIVDDDKVFVKNVVNFIFDDLSVDYYDNPQHFLNNVSKYPKDTTILLDNQFATGNLSGIQLAGKLHQQGYIKLFLLSGREFKQNEIPDYLTVIRKDNVESLRQIT